MRRAASEVKLTMSYKRPSLGYAASCVSLMPGTLLKKELRNSVCVVNVLLSLGVPYNTDRVLVLGLDMLQLLQRARV